MGFATSLPRSLPSSTSADPHTWGVPSTPPPRQQQGRSHVTPSRFAETIVERLALTTHFGIADIGYASCAYAARAIHPSITPSSPSSTARAALSASRSGQTIGISGVIGQKTTRRSASRRCPQTGRLIRFRVAGSWPGGAFRSWTFVHPDLPARPGGQPAEPDPEEPLTRIWSGYQRE